MSEQVIGKIIRQFIGVAVGALIGAFIVQLATKVIAKFKPSCWMAYKAVVIAYLLSIVIGVILSFLLEY